MAANDLRASVLAHPIIIAWFAIWVVGAVLNFKMGHELFSVWVGIAFIAVAMIGAYAAAIQGAHKGGQRAGLVVVMVAAFALGQWCGWQQLGLNMARSLTSLTSQSQQHGTSSTQLANARAEREALGVQRPIDSIAAERDLECRKTSRTYKDGKGPNCTKLMAEEGRARRAAELDAQLPELAQAMATAPQITDPDAPFAVPMAAGSMIGSWLAGKPVKASAADVVFYFSIFMIALLEFISVLGPWLFNFHDAIAGQRRPVSRYPDLERFDFGPKRVGYMPAQEQEVSAASDARHVGAPEGAHYPAGVDGLHLPLATPAPPPSAHMQGGALHGAPITVNLYGPDGGHTARASGRLPERQSEAQIDDNVAQLRAVPPRLQIARHDTPAPIAPDVPVDRSAVNALIDSLLVFKAACLVERGGAWIDADAVYQAYADWADARACAPAAFHTLFPVATGAHLHQVGGQPHYAGLAIKSDDEQRRA